MVGKADILKGIIIPAFEGVWLTLTISVKRLEATPKKQLQKKDFFQLHLASNMAPNLDSVNLTPWTHAKIMAGLL